MIYYQVGDATKPEIKEGAKNYIIHCCNDIGLWGAGFVIALNKTFGDSPRQAYFNGSQKLGDISIAGIGGVYHESQEVSLSVINMIGQHTTTPIEGIPPVRYPAIVKAMKKINKTIPEGSRIHFPLFCAGLAGGDWDTIEVLVNGILGKNFELFGYVFPTDEQYMYLPHRQTLLERIAKNPEIVDDLVDRMENDKVVEVDEGE